MQTLSAAQQIYQTSIKDLPIIEQLRLVQLVLDELMSKPDIKIVNESTVWDAEDYADLTRASLLYVAESKEEL